MVYRIQTCENAMSLPPTPRFDEWLCTRCKPLTPLKTAIVHPVDALSLQGAVDAAAEETLSPVLVGPKAKIWAVAEEIGADISSFPLIDTPYSHAAAAEAVAMAARGEVEALMKGKIATDELLHAVIAKEAGLRTGRRMSHVFVMDVPTYHKPLFLTDAAVNLAPDLMTKKDIIQNAVDLFASLGLGMPNVAVLAAVETVNAHMQATLDATALAKMGDRGQITGALIDGPLAFDNAISAEAARIKNILSPWPVRPISSLHRILRQAI